MSITPLEVAAVDYITKRRMKLRLRYRRQDATCEGADPGDVTCDSGEIEEGHWKHAADVATDDWCDACKLRLKLMEQYRAMASKADTSLRRLERLVVKETTP